MKNMYLIKNQGLFQGEQYLKTNQDYFEGWYFKNSNNKNTISFIPGININGTKREAFVQVITNDSSYFVHYDIDKFKFNNKEFCIKIGDNYFSKDKIHVDIKDNKNNLNIYGDIQYTNNKNINTNLLNPNIMGPFSYIPFMECNHAILSIRNDINGSININNNEIKFNKGTGYIEKDWGVSFPKTYIWCQGNSFKNPNVSFMCSIADIPFKLFNFRGMICVLKIDNKEYKFTTYNNAKIIEYAKNENGFDVILKKGMYTLDIKSTCDTANKLLAPTKGKMDRDILESVLAKTTVTLKKGNDLIFTDTSSNCGLEMV